MQDMQSVDVVLRVRRDMNCTRRGFVRIPRRRRHAASCMAEPLTIVESKIVTLIKPTLDTKLGIRLTGSGAHPSIASIHTGSVAAQDGTLNVGDVIVRVNGEVTTGHAETTHLLQRAAVGTVVLEILVAHASGGGADHEHAVASMAEERWRRRVVVAADTVHREGGTERIGEKRGEAVGEAEAKEAEGEEASEEEEEEEESLDELDEDVDELDEDVDPSPKPASATVIHGQSKAAEAARDALAERAQHDADHAAAEALEARLAEAEAARARAELAMKMAREGEAAARAESAAAMVRAAEAARTAAEAEAARQVAEARADAAEAIVDGARAASLAASEAAAAEAASSVAAAQAQAQASDLASRGTLAEMRTRCESHQCEALAAQVARSELALEIAEMRRQLALASLASAEALRALEARVAASELGRGDAEHRAAAAEAKAAELHVVMARSLAQQAGRNVTFTADKARSSQQAAEASAARAVAEARAAEAAAAQAKAEAAAAAALASLEREREGAAAAAEAAAQQRTAALQRAADAEAARSALATEVKAGWQALREHQQRATLKHKHASLREAELRSREEALWPSSGFFGNGSSTVRSREKFEMQLKLTQELERVILAKDHEIMRLQDLARTADG